MSHTMLYKCPGPHDVHGGKFDHIVVTDEEIPAHLAAGWHLTTPEAKAAHEAIEAARAAAAEKKGAKKPQGVGDLT